MVLILPLVLYVNTAINSHLYRRYNLNVTVVKQGRKGRPTGFRLSEASKRLISESKKGQKHKELTKNKISRSLHNYFRRKSPLSEEIITTYCRVSDDAMCEWMCEVAEELDNSRDVLTQRAMFNKFRLEISYGHNIEEIFSHSMTPEMLLMAKQTFEMEDTDEKDM